MADVRALLRQQRAARRIEHPHASYSDSGKLTCTVCQEHIKTESLWDGHLRGAGHRQRLQSLYQSSAKSRTNGYAGFLGDSSDRSGQPATSRKRNLDDSDEDMANEEEARRKRAKSDVPSIGQSPQEPVGTPAKQDDDMTAKPITPPLTRRASGTPTVGVEIQIPSRPATPSAGGTPMSMTPKAVPIGRSPLIPDESPTSQQQAPAPSTISDAQTTRADTTASTAPVDEDEWSAFEADLVHGTTEKSTAKPAAAAALDSDAVISAPVMSAAEVAAKSEEEEKARRRALVDIQIEDEKEEATRALETEFEVMEELEARARRLRERREALRLKSGGTVPLAVAAAPNDKMAAAEEDKSAAQADEDEEDEEDEDDEYDWDGFRLRA